MYSLDRSSSEKEVVAGPCGCLCSIEDELSQLSDLLASEGGVCFMDFVNPLSAKLNPICHLLALLGTHHILHISRVRVKYVFGT